MTIIHIPQFQGIAPRIADRKLSNAQSQTARDCELFSGELEPLRDFIEVNTPSKAGTKKSIYLLGSTWLHWLTDVDVVRAPLYLENELRIHYSGHYNPKSTDDTLAVASGTNYPTSYYRLGIPQPDTTPTVAHTGGTGNDVERGYVYSFVSAWGEEGPPSPVTSYVGKADATSWDITTIDATPENEWTNTEIASISISGTTVTVNLAVAEHHFFETTEYVVISGTFTGTGDLPADIIGTWQVTRIDYNSFTFELTAASSGTVTGFTSGVITREAPLNLSTWTKRLYRTIGNNFRHVESNISGTTYTDTVADEDLGELLPGGLDSTKWWKAPNGDMQGLTALPGGAMAGFFGNTLALSEPFVTSAWPEEYQHTFNFDIVGIAAIGSTIVVMTEGYPSLVIGDHPDSMVATDLELFQACVSKRGIASLVNGVLYPSPDGLVYVPAAGMPYVITQPYFKKKDWELYSPSTFVASVYDDRYYAFYTNGGEDGNESGGIIFDPKESGAVFTTLSTVADGLHSDLETDSLYLINDDNIIQWDSGSKYLTYTWLSKLFTTARPVCFKAAKVKLSTGSGFTIGETAAAIAAVIAALEAQLAATALNTGSFGSANNYYSGGFAGGSVGEYAVASGPYYDAVAALGRPITALLNIYAWYDNGSGSIERHLMHTEDMTGSKPFRIGNVDKGMLADSWEIEINANDLIVHEIMLGTSMRELSKA